MVARVAEPLLVLFDDQVARAWEPFALTRPAGELRYGVETLRERAERVFGLECAGHLVAPEVSDYDEPWAAPVLRLEELPRDRDLLFWSSRAVAEAPPHRAAGPLLLALGGEACGWWAPAGSALPDESFLLSPSRGAPSDLPVGEVPGELLARVWDLVLKGPDRLIRDAEDQPWGRRAMDARVVEESLAAVGAGVLGESPLFMEAGVDVEPGVVLDLREGPIWLDQGATVKAFTRLAGPSYVGRGSVVLGGSITGSTIGPVCKVHGEIEESVFLGWSNKAHDGFLGHAYVGAWVNLGALTTNSDLKNNYGPVRVWTPGGEEDTGSMKVGCFLGDHVKTAIGTMINTGTVVGAGANLFGGTMPPKRVLPFAWGSAPDAGAYDVERFLETAEKAMARRDIALSQKQRRLLVEAWRRGRGEAP